MRAIFCLLCFLTTLSIQSQSIQIIGPTSVDVNYSETYYFNETIDTNSFPPIWSITGGTILYSYDNSVSVYWTTVGTGVLSLEFDALSYYGSLNVTVNNYVYNPPNPTVLSYSCDYATLKRSGTPPSGITWHWQGQNSNGTSTTNGSGDTFLAYNSGMYYIRARDNTTGEWSPDSGSINVSIPSFNPGSINGQQTICYNGNPNILNNVSSASGGSGTYNYQWQYSNNGSSGWTDISGATGTSYDPPAGLTATRYYRRKVSCGTRTTYTSNVQITVNPTLNAGAINGAQTICYNGNPTVLGNATSPSGGNGSYAYQWQTSSDNSSWSNVSGATSSTYDPPVLTTNRWYRRAVTSCGETKYSTSVKITVNPTLNPGSVNGAQTICYNGSPSILGNATSPSGGNGSYAYQWQSSPNNSTWTDISGATASTYDPANLTATTWYRRRVISCGETKYSTSVSVTVNPSLNAGSISGTQSVCYNGNPTILGNATSPSGGDGSYAYQWQISSDNSTFTNISGATASTYDPGNLTSTQWFRRRVISCGETKYTSSIRILVSPILTAGQISGTQTVCYNGNPTILNNTTSAGGGDSTYSYQWQSSPNNSTWTDISGATSTTYDPASLTATTWYRRKVTSCSQTQYTSSVQVTVNPTLVAGAISGTQTVCYNGNPTILGNATSPSGGDGTFAYQWQSSPNNSTWTDISGATTSTYDPASLTATTWFRRRVISCGETKYSTSVSVTVNPTLIAGSISGTQTLCQGEDAAILNNSTAASGGNGSYTYQWQQSADNSNWTDVSGATSSSYDPGILNVDTWYRRKVSSCSETKYSGSIKITVNPLLTWYADADGDGFGEPGTSVTQCTQPVGYVSNGNDLCPGEYGTNEGCDFVSPTLSDKNYIYVRSYQTPMQSDTNINSNDDVIASVQYFDGIGRPEQSIAIKSTPSLQDIVTHFSYDSYGRPDKDWLPYVAGGTPGTFKTGDQRLATQTFYKAEYPDDFNGISTANTNPFSQKLLEASPLGRPLKQAAPGEAWKLGNNHEIEFDYLVNTHNPSSPTDPANDNVRLHYVTFAGGDPETPQLSGGSGNYYAEGELYKTVTKDENWTSGKDHTTEEFKDKQGRVILKRTYNGAIVYDTYYVYDDFGNLTYVLPPKVDTSDGISATELSELCYQYKYDKRNRLVEKKIPGKDWEYIVYNKLDQPILTQDANLRATNTWFFTKYDAFGRVAYTGKATDSRARTAVQAEVTSLASQLWVDRVAFTSLGGAPIYYSNHGYPNSTSTTTLTEVLTISYYDDYNFPELLGSSVPSNLESWGVPVDFNAKGLPTVSQTKVLDTTSDWVSTVIAYDHKGRQIWNAVQNTLLQTTDIVATQLDFAGRVTGTYSQLQKTGQADIIVIDLFEYDHVGRLTKQTQQLGDFAAPKEVIAENTYDNLGQLVQKGVGNTDTGNRLQTVEYNYNVRGWLKRINNPSSLGTDLFGFEIRYNTSSHGGTPLYNGNIAETEWRTANTDNSLKWYRYNYDALNRLTSAIDNTGNYNLPLVDYDKNGNIMHLKRNGHRDVNVTAFGLMDDLSYTYSGNQLQSIDDSSSGSAVTGFIDGAETTLEYTYDGNGNMKTDANKGITGITYNHLNLPTQVTTANGNISYIYDAAGSKLRKVVNETGVGITTTDYAGNYIYENGTLQFFAHAEGYITPDGMGGYDYIYQYKDHLGNIRLSYVEDGNGGLEIVEENNYYPFGLKHKGYNGDVAPNGNSVAQKWSFLGQERQDELGINWLTFRYRNYMPEIGRFFGVDPISEEYHYITPYQFASNNPVWKVELEGLEGQETSGMDMIRQGFAKIWDAVFGGVKVGQNGMTKSSNKERVAQFAQGGNMVAQGAATKEVAHVALDVVGTAEPTPITDTVHSIWYAAEGEYVNAGLTMAGVIPYLGDTFKAGKYLKYSDEIVDLVKTTGKLDGAPKEIVTVLKEGTLENGIKVAEDVIGGLGDDVVEVTGKFKNQKDVVTGYSTANGKKGWRIDYDPKTKGGHINWWNGNKKGAIPINAGEDQINQILKNRTF